MITKNITKAILIAIGIDVALILGFIVITVLRIKSQRADSGGGAAVSGGISAFWVIGVLVADTVIMAAVFLWLQSRDRSKDVRSGGGEI